MAADGRRWHGLVAMGRRSQRSLPDLISLPAVILQLFAARPRADGRARGGRGASPRRFVTSESYVRAVVTVGYRSVDPGRTGSWSAFPASEDCGQGDSSPDVCAPAGCGRRACPWSRASGGPDDVVRPGIRRSRDPGRTTPSGPSFPPFPGLSSAFSRFSSRGLSSRPMAWAGSVSGGNVTPARDGGRPAGSYHRTLWPFPGRFPETAVCATTTLASRRCRHASASRPIGTGGWRMRSVRRCRGGSCSCLGGT